MREPDMPERYRVRYAHSAEEVLRELESFLDYVRRGPVMQMLPRALHDIASQDATDVAKWQEKIEHVRRTSCPAGAVVGFWLELLDEMFEGARRRLDELSRGSSEGAAPMDYAKRSIAGQRARLDRY
jgi:hypothetical protein